MLDKARTLPVDQVFMDIEDAVAPLAKPQARKNIVAALNEGDTRERSGRFALTTGPPNGHIPTSLKSLKEPVQILMQ